MKGLGKRGGKEEKGIRKGKDGKAGLGKREW